MSQTLNISAFQIQKTGAIANSVFTPGPGMTWELRSLEADYTSSATPGNRQIEIQLFQGANVLLRYVVGPVQAAGLTKKYCGVVGSNEIASFRDTDYLFFGLPLWFIDAGMSIKIADNKAVDAADTCISSLCVVATPNS